MAQAGKLKNLLAAWSRLLLSSLADAGITDVVLSPGSRSTPFMIAAEAEPRLRCHDSIDERAAAFFALGQARVTGRPSVVICTSGTAVAHYLPAVVEANLAGVPLIVLSSDRPLELQDSAAAQTIDQIKLFGGQVRRFYELGTPDPSPAALIGLRRLAAQAVFSARGGGSSAPGPVHLNARARKPLEPVAASTAGEHDLDAFVGQLLGRPIVTAFAAPAEPAPAAVAAVASLCRAHERGVIVAGPAPVGSWPDPWIVDALAEQLGYPLFTEATSQLRLAGGGGSLRVDAFDFLLRSPSLRRSMSPELVIQLGGAPTSSGFEQLCTGGLDAHVVVHPHTWVDPGSSATHVVMADPAAFAHELLTALGAFARGPTVWTRSWMEAEAEVWSVIDEATAGSDMTEAALIRTLVPALPAGSLLMVGNSLPIRNLDAYAPSASATVEVVSQRGANGIDGLIAGAAGAASVDGQTVTLLLGDVSFLHDLTGLALAAWLRDVTLVIVVANNSGGRIFETLPIASSGLGPDYVNHVTTPHRFALEHAARLVGVRYHRADDPRALASTLLDAWSTSGCTVVEVGLPPDGGSALQREILRRTEAATAARRED